MEPLRIAVNARLISGVSGGVETVVIGLAHGLSRLDDGDEEYLFLTYPDADEWIRPYIDGPCRILPGTAAPTRPVWKLKGAVGRVLPAARPAWRKLSALAGRTGLEVPSSDGTVERAGAHVVHFPFQSGFLTQVPTVYQPHDLQHVHLPQFFSPRERAERELLYGTMCRHARLVPTVSTWIQQDVIRHYFLDDDRVRVIPLAPILDAYPDPSEAEIAEARTRLALPDEFVYYPAQTFPHKNHLNLLEALAILRDRDGLTVPFVSSGRLSPYYREIEKRVEALRLGPQTRFLGFVSPLDVKSLFRSCRALVIPTRFEASSMPLWDAFHAGVPATCSNVTSLPRQAGDAALVFDPDRPDQIADCIGRLWTDEKLRATLIERGRANVARFSWDRTARHFRAHYRRIAERPLSDEDRELISEPPLL